MKSTLKNRGSFVAVVLVLVMSSPVAWAEGVDDFELVKAIPADAFLVINTRDHQGKEFINKQMQRVWEAIEAARFDNVLKRMLKRMQRQQLPPGTELESFDKQWQRISDLCATVEWSALGKREFAMGMKMNFPMHEFVVLMMPPADKVQSSFEGLSGILDALAELDPNRLSLTREEDRGATIHRMGLVGAMPFPMELALARHGDTIVLGFGSTMMEQTLALLRGHGGQAVAATPRFMEAFAKLPAPADKLFFFDLAKFWGQIRQYAGALAQMAEAAAPAEGEPGYEDYLKSKALPGKIIDSLDLFEYYAEVTSTSGMKMTKHSVAVLRDDAGSRALYPVAFGNKPLEDPLKYVPKEAGEFYVTSGVDLPALYEAVVKILREDVPNGEAVLAKLDELKNPETGIGLDLEKDVFGWIGGSLSLFSVPGPTPYAAAEFVIMLSVRDEAKAREMLERLAGTLETSLVQLQAMVVDAKIENTEGFKSLVLPALGMLGINQATFGIKDGWLFFGSSPDIIEKTLQTAGGKAENFSKNDRFTEEGIQPEGSVTSLSFRDMTKLGEKLGYSLQMLTMAATLEPELRRDPMMSGLLSALSKAGRVVRKLDFFQSGASRTTFDGKMLVTKSIVTYREPPLPSKPEPPATQAAPEESEAAEPKESGE